MAPFMFYRTTRNKTVKDTILALDPNLPLLASQAAIELDNLIRGQNTDFPATKRLASVLNESIDGAQEGTERKFFVPSTATLIIGAFRQSAWAVPVHTVTDLVVETAKVTATLKNLSPHADRKSLEQVRAFCAALAESVASYQHARYSQFSMHLRHRASV